MEELQAIIAALVGGARYGLKVRLPHALVMTMLFRRDLTSAQKIQTVVRLAVEHASRLASFATVYKVSHSRAVSIECRSCQGWSLICFFLSFCSLQVLLAAFKFASRTIHREFGDGGKSLGALLLKCIGKCGILIHTVTNIFFNHSHFALQVDGPFSLQTDQLPSNMLPGRPERPYHALGKFDLFVEKNPSCKEYLISLNRLESRRNDWWIPHLGQLFFRQSPNCSLLEQPHCRCSCEAFLGETTSAAYATTIDQDAGSSLSLVGGCHLGVIHGAL